ncbi:MAG TPA: Hsp20/alpha crystallin family protein [Fibrobacteria bacterium]|nr:Hsp20/alpha crystallin family protein [Fibrobacteria bacterium]
MATTEVTKRGRRDASSTAESLVNVENAFLADSDIYETEEALFLRMDMPGVEKGNVRIEVDEDNVLQVRAKNSFEEPKGAVMKEFQVGDYYRSFRIGDMFDKEKIAAKLDQGILEITVPKREAAKPRRIEISA